MGTAKILRRTLDTSIADSGVMFWGIRPRIGVRHAHHNHNNDNNRKIDSAQAVSCKRLFTKILAKVTTKKVSKFYCQSAFFGNSNGTEPEQKWFVHTHQTSCRGGWWRKFGTLNSNPYSQIFTQSVLVSFSPRSYLFTSATVRTGVYTAPIKEWHKTYPVCDARL